MPADSITPGLAAAWTPSTPSNVGVEARVVCVARASSNIATFSTCTATIDGVSLQGTGATAGSRLVLLTAQTTTSQNGVYVATANGASVNVSGNFASGQYVKSGLEPGQLYYFLLNTAGNSIGNGTQTLTESGFITPSAGGTLTIYGTGSTAQLNYLSAATLERSSLFNEPNEFPRDLVVRVDGGTGAPTWWRLTAAVNSIGTTPVIFEQISSTGKDVGYEDNPFDDTAPAGNTVSRATAWDNTAPTADTRAGDKGYSTVTNVAPSGNIVSRATAFDDTAPFPDSSVLLKGYSNVTNTAPSANTVSRATAWDNTSADQNSITSKTYAAVTDVPATSIVLQGEQSPAVGTTTPASPTAVAHTTTLVSGTNYIVQVGTRSANVNIVLPDPPSLAQRIEIADISGQAATFNVAVNCGTKQISDTSTTTYTINRNFAVLVLSYTGTAWKIL